jgi:hypothetical protein
MSRPTDTPENTPKKPVEVDWLDDIFEDLIVGHNFDYASQAIRKEIKARETEIERKARINELTLLDNEGFLDDSQLFHVYYVNRVGKISTPPPSDGLRKLSGSTANNNKLLEKLMQLAHEANYNQYKDTWVYPIVTPDYILDIAHYVQARTNRAVAEAQTSAVAWTIGQIGNLHYLHIGQENSTTTDRLFKGIKNHIRDQYREQTGIDPAPEFPVNVQLHAQNQPQEPKEAA